MSPNNLKLSGTLMLIFSVLFYANKILASALFFGILTSFSPCNFILAPILLAQLTKNPGKMGAISFMIGVVIANVAVGLSIVMLKSNFADIFQSHYIKYFMATILIYFATSLLDITPSIPKFRVNAIVPNNYNYNLAFGFFSALTLSPCNSAALAATLNLCIDAQNVTTILIMTFYGIGTIISMVTLMFGRESLKPGFWLDWVNIITAAVILVFGLRLIFQTALIPINYEILSGIFIIVLCSVLLLKRHKNSKQQQ